MIDLNKQEIASLRQDAVSTSKEMKTILMERQSKLHESVIEAAKAYYSPEDITRSILLAQAQPEAITADAVFAAQNELMKRGKLIPASELRAALSAALTYIAKEGE